MVPPISKYKIFVPKFLNCKIRTIHVKKCTMQVTVGHACKTRALTCACFKLFQSIETVKTYALTDKPDTTSPKRTGTYMHHLLFDTHPCSVPNRCQRSMLCMHLILVPPRFARENRTQLHTQTLVCLRASVGR
jgi:hypothetical protein